MRVGRRRSMESANKLILEQLMIEHFQSKHPKSGTSAPSKPLTAQERAEKIVKEWINLPQAEKGSFREHELIRLMTEDIVAQIEGAQAEARQEEHDRIREQHAKDLLAVEDKVINELALTKGFPNQVYEAGFRAAQEKVIKILLEDNVLDNPNEFQGKVKLRLFNILEKIAEQIRNLKP